MKVEFIEVNLIIVQLNSSKQIYVKPYYQIFRLTLTISVKPQYEHYSLQSEDQYGSGSGIEKSTPVITER